VRADLPSGTVTFLFTDVEGSTKLLHELGADSYAEALAEHRRVIREACVANGGVEVDTQGDAFFFVFPTAPGAVAAASAMAEALEPGPIRVRAGVHTGTPLLAEEGYVGDDVHRAARIAAAGHGGQVLVSSSTAGLLVLELTDLGEHRFKDLGAPERVYQLGDGTFPLLKSLYRTNLPVPATAFVGRERELADVADLLRSSGGLLTLTGPGGTGKTRLAVHAAAEAAESFQDGIWWVPLSPLQEASLLDASVAQVLEVDEQPGRELADGIAARLGGKRALLILDNAEHLMPEIADGVASLRVAGTAILVTSRERLQLQGEHVYSVPSLEHSDGVELFLTRARSLDFAAKESPAVAELCTRLDNLPLALELAAARTAVFSPEQLVDRLSERLDLLKGARDADPRQQTLRATIEWSYDLLDPEEQRLFRGLSVFAGSCNYEAAETVCEADVDTLQSLLDKSLLRHREEQGQRRYWMLETIRELATERLAAEAEDGPLRRRHAEHYLIVARAANLAAESLGPQRHDLVIPELDNFRTALAWALEADERELGLELVVALENLWATTAPQEGATWAKDLLEGSDIADELRSRALRVQGGMENIAGHLDQSEQLWQQALTIAREQGDDQSVAILLHRLASLEIQRGNLARVRSLAEESLAGHRKAGFPKGKAQALTSLAEVEEAEGNPERALELLDEARRLSEEVGFRWWQAGALARMGRTLVALGRLDEAGQRARSALAISSSMHDRPGTIYELRLLGEISGRSGDHRRAGTIWGAVDAEADRAPVSWWLHGRQEPERLPEQPDAEFELGWEEGRALSLDDAVAFALDGDQ
jgi:predicted ATPase/class 3 adenylate cyclase